MELFILHSSMEIGKNSLVTWMKLCKTTTMIVMDIIPSLDWFGWVNVFRMIHILYMKFRQVNLSYETVYTKSYIFRSDFIQVRIYKLA